jgi:uncharacterized protein (DUF2236 family)
LSPPGPRPGPSRPPRLPLGPDSLSAQLLGHPLVLLGGPRALLLELADPAVAQAVADHSSFEAEPVRRLARTLRVMDQIAFGPPAASRRAAARLRRLHARVRGAAYAADDPELLLWVHATLVDTVVCVDRRYLGLLDSAGRRRYYDESRAVAEAVGVPACLVPPDLEAFGAYFEARLEALEVGPVARRLAAAVLNPRLDRLGSPLALPARLAVPAWVKLVTADLLPAGLRAAYGLDSPLLCATSLAMEGASVLTRALVPRTPRWLSRQASGALASLLLGPSLASPSRAGRGPAPA